DLARQEAQGPIVVTFRRRTKTRGDDASLLVARQQLLHGRLLTLDSVERLFKSLLDESLAKSLHSSRPAPVSLGNALVGPMGPVGIGLEQNLCTSDFLPRSLQLLDNALKLDSFLLRQPHDIQLPHGTPPCAMQHRRFARKCQSDFLAVTEH